MDKLSTGHLLFQTKNAAGQQTMTLKLSDLEDLRKNSSRVGKTGVFIVNFGENKEFFLLRKQDFDYYFMEPEENV